MTKCHHFLTKVLIICFTMNKFTKETSYYKLFKIGNVICRYFFYFYSMRIFVLIFVAGFSVYSFAQDSTISPIIQDSVGAGFVIDSVKTNVLQDSVSAAEINVLLAPTTTPAIPAVSEDMSDRLIKNKKFSVDRVRILFSLDISPLNPLISEHDVFRDEYFPVKDSASVFTNRDTKTNFKKTSNLQFGLQFNFWKGLFFGMNYQFFTINNYKKDPNMGNLLSKKNTMFIIVATQFGYVFELLKNKCLQIEPAIRLGGYTADDYYDRGKGKKFYFGADFKIRYLIKKKFGFSLGCDYDYLVYKRKGYSNLYNRDTYQKTTFNNFHVNAGFCFNITINPKKKYAVK